MFKKSIFDLATDLGYRAGQQITDIFNTNGINIFQPNVPDILTRGYEKTGGSDLYLPPSMQETIISPSGWISYNFSYLVSPPPVRTPPALDSKEFETDMMEALIGWRQWYLIEGTLRSINNTEHCWLPNAPFEARCGSHWDHAVPSEFCTCGIYAKVEKEKYNTDEPELIWGQVYGWGRYVLGDEAQRTQFAYPKAFYLQESQVDPNTMEALQKYHVPIFVDQPMMVYNPEEDGYEYRNDETNRHLGSNQNPDAAEAAGEGEED